jgi:hypothetical protein
LDRRARLDQHRRRGRGFDLLPFGATGRPGQSASAQTIVERDQTLVDIHGVETAELVADEVIPAFK